MKTRKIVRGSVYGHMFVNQDFNFYTPEQLKVLSDSKSKKKKVECVNVSLSVLRQPMTRDGYVLALPIDPFAGKHFMLNASGFPMNDIMLFEESQSDSIARAALARIQKFDRGKDDGLTLEERIKRIVPNNWSSPSEFVRASKKIASLNYAMEQDRIRSSQVSTTTVESSVPDTSINVSPE